MTHATFTRKTPRSFLTACSSWFAVLFTPIAAWAADNGAVSGRVSNAASRAYLENAEVRIDGSNAVAITNRDGSFTLSDVPAGEHTVVTRYAGLDDRKAPVTV